ncbi:MAG TPA: hypothetical protein VIJ77_08915 [Candidatus Tumulicola sp.]
MKILRPLVVAVALGLPAALLAGCGNGGASEPPVTSLDPAATSKLQFAVGVATMAYNHGQSVAYGLNTVLTLRQPDGLSGTLYNIPQIIGPTSFNVLTSTETGSDVQSAGSDFGTNHVTWSTLNQPVWTGGTRGQKASSTGAFGYGFCPCNSDAGPVNGTSPLYQAFSLPVYGNNQEVFYGGPPAFPQADPALLALGWEGYSLGFTDFAVQPVIGVYHLYAAVPPAYTTPQNPTPSPNPASSPTPPPGVLAASAQLSDLTPLPPFPTPTFHPDGKGGGTIAVHVPNGATEALVVVKALRDSGNPGDCVLAHTSDAYYTMVAKHAGISQVALPDNIGPQTSTGQPSASICPEGSYQIYAAGTDYPAYEASYPANLSQLPRIRGARGRADVTTSDILNGAYP